MDAQRVDSKASLTPSKGQNYEKESRRQTLCVIHAERQECRKQTAERKGLLSRQREYGIMREAKRGWEGDCLSPVSVQGTKLHDTDGL